LSWLNERKRIWRVITLAGLLLAILGPWAFDRTLVAAEYPCSRPHIRLKGDFCGLPLSGLWGIWLYIGVAISALIGEVLILTAGGFESGKIRSSR
jgi:hypothetical protein